MNRSAVDALAVLADDHRAVQQLLAEFDELASGHAGARQRRDLAHQICHALTAHAMAAEQVFYPAVADALADDDLIDDALAEHDGLRALVEQIESLDANDERFDALVMMLASAVGRHVRQEERELFPRVRAEVPGLERLGERIIECRDETLRLLAESPG